MWSASVDGNVKEWTYGKRHAIANYVAPDSCRTTVSFSADGARLVYWNCYPIGALAPVRLTCYVPLSRSLNFCLFLVVSIECFVGSFHVEPLKMEYLTLLNGVNWETSGREPSKVRINVLSV